jgi:DNA processing protein
MMDVDYVTLTNVNGIGPSRPRGLLGHFHTATAVLRASIDQIAAVAGMSRAAATAIKNAPKDLGEKICKRANELGAVILIPPDSRFPKALREIPDAPMLLFARGRLELLQSMCVGVVGSRDHTRYGGEVCRRLAGEVAAAGLTVVSGMARGLDAVAHHAALDAGGGTIGILGNGLGIVYPAANRVLYDRVALSGCLLTEFPPGERPNAGSFPRRNRLISGLSRVTVVVEAGAGSGALITAECALAQGREVLAVPGPITSRVSVGTNHLIQSGAKPVLEPSDILEEYGLVAEAPQLALPADLSEGEKRLLDILTTHDQDIDILQGRYGAEMSEVAAVLTSLEIRGMVLQSPGKAFRRK